jgi:hypothetical protein
MSEATRSFINSAGLALSSATLTFLMAWLWWRKNEAVSRAKEAAAAHKVVLDDISELKTNIRLINLSRSEAFQAQLIEKLTHHHTPVIDALMAKVGPPNVLTQKEDRALTDELIKRASDPAIDDEERLAAVLLPGVMVLVKMDQKEIENMRKPTSHP